MTCLRYEELKKQLEKMIADARMMKENCTEKGSEAYKYWEAKEIKLIEAFNAVEAAQYMKKPEMK